MRVAATGGNRVCTARTRGRRTGGARRQLYAASSFQQAALHALHYGVPRVRVFAVSHIGPFLVEPSRRVGQLARPLRLPSGFRSLTVRRASAPASAAMPEGSSPNETAKSAGPSRNGPDRCGSKLPRMPVPGLRSFPDSMRSRTAFRTFRRPTRKRRARASGEGGPRFPRTRTL